jgi:MoxR-like ATPase
MAQKQEGKEIENVIAISLNDIPKVLENTPINQAVLILGPPGVGKSSIVKEFGRQEGAKMGREVVEYSDKIADSVMANPWLYYVIHDMRLSEYVESDFLGFPKVSEVNVLATDKIDSKLVKAPFKAPVAEYVPMKWALTFSRPGVAGLIFIDELTNIVKPELQSLAYKLVLDRKIGGVEVSPQVRIVGAGNTPDYSSIAMLLPAPLASRFAIYYVRPPELDQWFKFIRERRGKLHPAIAGFLAKEADKFMKTPEEPEILHNFPNPRSWDMLNAVLFKIIGDGTDVSPAKEDELRAVAQAYIGPEVAPEFVAFTILGKYLPRYEDVQQDPGVIFMRADQASRDAGDDLRGLGVIYYSLAYVANEVNRRKDLDTARAVIQYLKTNKKGEYEAVFTSLLGEEEWNKLLEGRQATPPEELKERARRVAGKK